MTDKPDRCIAWQKPADFAPRLYVLATRWFNSEKDDYNEQLNYDGTIRKFDRLGVSHKTDTNNHGPVSSNFIGTNYAWPEADYKTRVSRQDYHRMQRCASATPSNVFVPPCNGIRVVVGK